MMTRYVALLRGIAPSRPGNSNTELRGVLEHLGFDRVESVLASGNILFESAEADVPALERTIQEGLVARLGIGGGTIIRSVAELAALIERDPFDGLVHGRGTYLIASFVKHGRALPPTLPHDPDPLVRVVGVDLATRSILAVVDNSDPGPTPDFMRWLDRTYGKGITTRTWLTVQRIVDKGSRP